MSYRRIVKREGGYACKAWRGNISERAGVGKLRGKAESYLPYLPVRDQKSKGISHGDIGLSP